MKWTLAASLFAVLVIETHAPPVDACGVKLTVKSSAPRKAVARTSNPSEVLLVGNPSRRLERDLVAAGHRVEVAPKASAAKKKSYAVVIVDAGMQDEARSQFGDNVVAVRSGDVAADIRSVEKQVARRPVQVGTSRTVVAARENPTPIAAGPPRAPNREIVAASEPKETTPPPAPPPVKVVAAAPKVVKQPEPKPEPKPVAEVRTDVVTPTAEPKPKVVTPTPEPKPKVAVKASAPGEMYFGLNSAKTNSASLAKAIHWLTASADVQVIVEGHADPTGNPDANMMLAQKRAEWVRDQLVAGGIDQSRIEVISYGDTRLKYARTDGRNRRVEIVAK